MDPEDLLRHQGDLLEPQIWDGSARDLRAVQATLPGALRHLGLRVADLLARISDEGLVIAIQKDFFTDEAFEVLLANRYQRVVFRWFCRRWRLPHDANDLTQKLLLKLWRTRFRTYRPGEAGADNFRRWLWRVAENVRNEHLRQKQRQPGSVEHPPDPPDGGPGPCDAAVDRELEEQLEAAMATLRPPETFVLRETMAGRKAGEIARAMGWPVTRVYRLLFQARTRVLKELGLPPPPYGSGR